MDRISNKKIILTKDQEQKIGDALTKISEYKVMSNPKYFRRQIEEYEKIFAILELNNDR